ncbi:CDP-alcohol phosphatidyltransferase family protein [Jejuia pallidilutea]|uniref:CDP-diacylglycerol--glycerol-3-phosphate 3-phosphatidyltransferase n=1 Tax=Jejuia pallidilutea TaxID=504487 RepID=A0A090VR51_9FLAO|nr:CDP-alcohol phosphatidyltransferase family protein [Jejuia pallidilutea]PQV50456.1 CDP-diacylglycerol--glycerol-3-phosphate 3-phosphatidyltransferase [Jejuia pallidilutea]GAL65789.1 CDP-diacylglycerol-glycerol-3-phosphate 3-phosphatidyltransferase [Jejuia pallidilutea]GAL88556.1 CDP-diacylglycerol-glycerol-3-phosphate 3-phosphatidyltransferase [Jejuia pallidilutea]
MLTFKNFNIADWFSFYRIIAAPFLLALIWYGERQIFTWFLLISYATDAIDGYLARALKITSPRGSQLDSFGDQITFIIGLIGLFYFETSFIKTNLILICIAFIPYAVQMFIAYYKYGKATAFHTYLAKLSAVIQSIFILWALFFSPEYVLFYGMLIIGLLETLEEITLIFMYDVWAADVKGIYWAFKDKRRLKKIKRFNKSK